MQPTFKDLWDFVILNKKDKVFTNCTESDIFNELSEGITNGTLFYHTDSEGNIIGMILARKEPGHVDTLHVLENLAMSMTTLKIFAKEAKKRWPNYKLIWEKHGQFKQHNTEKFYKRLHV